MKYVATMLLAAACFLAPLSSMAQVKEGTGDGNRKIVRADQVIEGDYSAIGELVEIAGVVNGNVFASGGQVIVAGEIRGDLTAVGGTVSIAGKVGGDARILAGQTVVSGEIGRNATIGGAYIEVADRAKIGGKIVAVGVSVILAGPVEESVKIGGRYLVVDSAVGQGAEAAVESIRLTSRAVIHGDFLYWSNTPASVDKEAQVEGEIIRKSPRFIGNLAAGIPKPLQTIGSIAFLFGFGVLFISVFKGFTRLTLSTLRRRPVRSFHIGVTTLLLIPVLFGILIITAAGVPLGFVLLAFSSVIFYVARIFAILWAGTLLLERFGKKENEMRAFGLGLLLYSLLIFIPIVGWTVSFLTVLFGLGAALVTLKEILHDVRQDHIQA